MLNVVEDVGRTAVFIETSNACLCTVESASSDANGIRASFRHVPDSFQCRLRFWINPGEDQIEKLLTVPPFGDQWDVAVSNREFCIEADHWQALFLFGSGFRVFFQPSFVSRFAAGDVSWLHEFYGDDEEYDDASIDPPTQS